MRARSARYFLVAFFCFIEAAVFGAWYVHAAAVPLSSLPDTVKKKLGIGKSVSVSGWAWNGALGWVSQRGKIESPGKGTFGIVKSERDEIIGWSWSANYGWICWGKTCTSTETSVLSDTVTYGAEKPVIESAPVDPDVRVGASQTFPIFGDGKVEGIEQCDHGSEVSDESCAAGGRGIAPATSTNAVCGNGIKEATEVCDDGDFDSTNACNTTCDGGAPLSCGNGIKEQTERCDDGDRDNMNACKNDCTESGMTVRQNEYEFPVSGWIKAIILKNDGWISLRGKVSCNGCPDDQKDYGVTYDPDRKEFRGWAWSPTLGWIVFSGKTLYDTEYRYAKVTPPGGGDGKYYDVVEYQSGAFRILIPQANGKEREYLLDSSYNITSAIEFERNADGTINDTTIQQIASNNQDAVEVFDKQACQEGCDISYKDQKSTWKTQLSSPWVQTAGGNVFSRKGFGGGAVAFRSSVQYLMYSGGITLEKDLRAGESFELSCCTDSKASVTKIGVPQTIVNPSYKDAAELGGGNEVQLVKRSGKVKKKSGANESDVSNDLDAAFSWLIEGEERRLKKVSGNVEVRIVHPLYTSIPQADVGMSPGDIVKITRGSDGKLKKNGSDFAASDPMRIALSDTKRIVGALTTWTSECDDSGNICSLVGRKKAAGSNEIIKEDALKDPRQKPRPDIAFPQKIFSQNIRRNTLGSLNIDALTASPSSPARRRNEFGYKVIEIQDENDLFNTRTNGLGGTIFVKNGDLSIGNSSGQGFRDEFRFNNGTENGSGTIIVHGGNLRIYRPLRYDSATISDIKKLASVAWIVLEKDGKGGNIIFYDCIPASATDIVFKTTGRTPVTITQPAASAAGIFFAEGTILTGTGDANTCGFTDDIPLYVDGMLIARKIILQRVYGGDPDLNLASETIQDTGRAVANTPPGFEDILKSLPVW